MRPLFITFLLSCLLGCNNSPGTNDYVVMKDSISTSNGKDSSLSYIHRFTDSALKSKISDALMKLPFIKKANEYIDSFSNHKHGIMFMLDSSGKDENEISVQAGYNGDQRFETYYRFYVNPKTLDIKVYDVVHDNKIPVKDFIKSQLKK